MKDRDLLLARGWREVAPSTWRKPNPDPRVNLNYTPLGAVEVCRLDDKNTVHDHASVTYRPTAEQAQIPLLAQCAAAGMHERDVIEHLFRQNQDLYATVGKLEAMQLPALIVMAPHVVHEGTIEQAIAMFVGYPEWYEISQERRNRIWGALRWLVDKTHGVDAPKPGTKSEETT